MSYHYNEISATALQNEIFILGVLQLILAFFCIFGYITLTTMCVIEIMFFEDEPESFLLYASLIHTGEALLIIILGFNAIFAAKYNTVDTDRGWNWKYLAYITVAVAAVGVVMTIISGYYIFIIPPACRIGFLICVIWRMDKFVSQCGRLAIPTYLKAGLGSPAPVVQKF